MTVKTISVPGPDSDVLAWCREHGLEPNEISVSVDVDDESGAVTLRRFVLDSEGRRQRDGLNEVLTEPVHIASPKRPFPTSFRRSNGRHG